MSKAAGITAGRKRIRIEHDDVEVAAGRQLGGTVTLGSRMQ